MYQGQKKNYDAQKQQFMCICLQNRLPGLVHQAGIQRLTLTNFFCLPVSNITLVHIYKMQKFFSVKVSNARNRNPIMQHLTLLPPLSPW